MASARLRGQTVGLDLGLRVEGRSRGKYVEAEDNAKRPTPRYTFLTSASGSKTLFCPRCRG